MVISKKDICSIVLLCLLIVQMNALVIHEYNLRQQGYTLIKVNSFRSPTSPNSAQFVSRDRNYFNIALCRFHGYLKAISNYLLVGFLVRVLCGSNFLLDHPDPDFKVERDKYFLSSIILRAPPVTTR